MTLTTTADGKRGPMMPLTPVPSPSLAKSVSVGDMSPLPTGRQGLRTASSWPMAKPTSSAAVKSVATAKPKTSYAQLITRAIQNSPQKRLTLSQIYAAVAASHPYYQSSATTSSWQNSVRHNLSLNRSFRKVPRPPGCEGKGSFWVLAGECETERGTKGSGEGLQRKRVRSAMESERRSNGSDARNILQHGEAGPPAKVPALGTEERQRRLTMEVMALFPRVANGTITSPPSSSSSPVPSHFHGPQASAPAYSSHLPPFPPNLYQAQPQQPISPWLHPFSPVTGPAATADSPFAYANRENPPTPVSHPSSPPPAGDAALLTPHHRGGPFPSPTNAPLLPGTPLFLQSNVASPSPMMSATGSASCDFPHSSNATPTLSNTNILLDLPTSSLFYPGHVDASPFPGIGYAAQPTNPYDLSDIAWGVNFADPQSLPQFGWQAS